MSNLILACRPCNQREGNQTTTEFEYARLMAHARRPLDCAAAMNATRYAIGRAIQALGLPTSFWTSGRTKFNRTCQGYPKDHWVNTACVGEDGDTVQLCSIVYSRLKRLAVEPDRWFGPTVMDSLEEKQAAANAFSDLRPTIRCGWFSLGENGRAFIRESWRESGLGERSILKRGRGKILSGWKSFTLNSEE